MTGTRPAAFGREELRWTSGCGRGDNTSQTTYSNSVCTLSPAGQAPLSPSVAPTRVSRAPRALQCLQSLSFDETLPELRSVDWCLLSLKSCDRLCNSNLGGSQT